MTQRDLAGRTDPEAVRMHIVMLNKHHETIIRKDLQRELWGRITRESSMVPVFGGDVYLSDGVEYMKLYH